MANYCLEAKAYICPLLFSYNKILIPNLDILKYEAFGPVLAHKKIEQFAELFRIPNEEILFFLDKFPFLYIITNFDKNYLTYKTYFGKLIQPFLALVFVSTNIFMSGKNSIFTAPEHINSFLDCFRNGNFDLNSTYLKALISQSIS